MTERIRSGFHRSGLRERSKLVFVFVFFVSVCFNSGVPFLFRSFPVDEQVSTASLFCRKHLKKLFLPSHFCWSL